MKTALLSALVLLALGVGIPLAQTRAPTAGKVSSDIGATIEHTLQLARPSDTGGFTRPSGSGTSIQWKVLKLRTVPFTFSSRRVPPPKPLS